MPNRSTALRRFAILAWLLFPAAADAQPAGADLHYRVWTTEEGLPQGSVRAVAQTADGYLWLATLDGLVRFDGVRMTVVTSADAPQLPSNRLTALLVDREDTLWIGTEDAGIVRRSGATYRVYGGASGVPAGQVSAIVADRDERIWAAAGSSWVVLEGDRWVPRSPPRGLPGIGPPPADVAVPSAAPDGRRSQRNARWTTGPSERLWVLDGGLLHRREGGRWETFPSPVPAIALPAPTALFEDREGSLWIGCEQGLVQASFTPVRALIPSGSSDARNVYTVAGDADGRVWITTQSEPLLWEDGQLTPLSAKPWWPGPGWMTIVEPDRDGSVLAGGPGRFFRVRPGQGFEPLPSAGVPHDVLRDRRGTLWLASDTGLHTLAGSRWERVASAPPDARVLLEARDGALWIGTYEGLVRVTDGETRIWTTADGLSTNRIRALHEDENGHIWIGTYDGGLNRFAADRFAAVRRRDGLHDDGVFAIVDGGDGRFYMSSNRGVHAVPIRELEAFLSGAARRVSSHAWRSTEGLPSSECNGWRQPSSLKAADGTLWFPTQKGIAVLHPRAVPLNAQAPPIVVEEIATDRRTFAPAGTVDLQPGERRLEVRYTANTFVRPEGARFRHRLEGFDDDWVEAGTRRFAQYTDLPPGRYVLRVLAANSDGFWNTRGVSLPIRVRPAFWQTWWVRGGAVLLVAAGLVGAYRRHVVGLRRRRDAQDAFARQLLDAQEAERKRVAGELYDGVERTLTVIRNRALVGLRSDDDRAIAEQIEAISTAAAEGIDEVRRIAHGLRPSQLDRLGLRGAIEALVEQSAAVSGVAIDATLDGAPAPADEIGVYRIVQEGVSNVVRHARATTARVAIRSGGDGLEIRIEDNGAGFDPAAVASRAGGLGLSSIAERARILGGAATIRSAPGQGTAIVVRVPQTTAGSPPATPDAGR